MKKTIVVKSVVEGKSGTSTGTDGRNFDWTMYNINSEAGETFSCFKVETAKKYRELIGKETTIDYTTKEFKGKVYFNVIESAKVKQEANIMSKLEEIHNNVKEIKRILTSSAIKPQDTPNPSPERTRSSTEDVQPQTSGNAPQDDLPESDPSFN